MESWQRWKNIVSRITGVSIPFFGISWQPPVSEQKIVEKALTFIESRNVLDISFEAEENPIRTYYDAEKIRDKLTELMAEVSRDTNVFQKLNAIREACSIFRRRLREAKVESGYSTSIPDEVGKNKHLRALGGFRDTCGMQIMVLCVMYRINVPSRLTGCLPPPDSPK